MRAFIADRYGLALFAFLGAFFFTTSVLAQGEVVLGPPSFVEGGSTGELFISWNDNGTDAVGFSVDFDGDPSLDIEVFADGVFDEETCPFNDVAIAPGVAVSCNSPSPAGTDFRLGVRNTNNEPLGDQANVIGLRITDLDGSERVVTLTGVFQSVDPVGQVIEDGVTAWDVEIGEGEVGECELAIAPASHNFGTVAINGTASQSFTISNSGEGDCTGLMVDVDGAGFSLGATDCGGTLGAGESCSADVDFSPTAAGNFSGSLDADANEDSASAALSGAGSVDPVDPEIVAIPTMNAMGLALMALLMLMIGVVSVRTFRS